MCGPDQTCWRVHVQQYHKRNDTGKPRDKSSSFYLLPGPQWDGEHTRSCTKYSAHVAARRIHEGRTPEAEIHIMEIEFHKIAKELKERQTISDSFSSACGVQVAASAGGHDDAGVESGLEDADAESEGEDNVGGGAAAGLVAADEFPGPGENSGTDS